MTTDDLAGELRRLIDERDVVATALRYCRTLDDRDWDGLRDVFVADATATFGGSGLLDGLPAITAQCRAALGPLDASQHLVSNHEVAVDGDAATHRCELVARHRRRGAADGPEYLVVGRYDDRFVRTPDGWRITARVLTVTWDDGNVGVVLGDRRR